MNARKPWGLVEIRRTWRPRLCWLALSHAITIMAAQAETPAPRHPGHAQNLALRSQPQGERAEATTGKPAPKLPPLPPGVTELKFSEFFVHPVGVRGLELTDKMRKLDGQRVRILGFMAQQESSPPGVLVLTPVLSHECHDVCQIDDLPPTRVHVIVTGRPNELIPYTPKLLLLTGTLSLGNRTESDGQISMVRLILDAPKHRVIRRASPSANGAEGLVSLAAAKRRTAP